ncbi:antigen-presenting glycoprotein CD1d-like isoform X5 [Dermochelys coriacea]|uniref:antigen-presenting glycoprotein CD1d-like isoform X5 n=1 Tax=Dermochelys coriacea TaxID=27794 RepID=UPI0018E8B92A|nr:antigen-presenting glycoprotein CD1d-like isoform X5 [Dermochelys coriacea]
MWATLDPLSRCPDTRHSLDPPSPARMLLPLLLLPWAWGTLAVTRIAQQQAMGYPFVTQASLCCELHPNVTSRGLYDAAGNGEGIMSFEVDMGTWAARSEDKLALHTRDLLNWDKSASARLQGFFRITCIYLLRTFVVNRKESLERQERLVAVVFARAPPPAGTPAPLLLVCRVTGFYPRPIRVAWLQDGEEVVPGGRLNSSGILPNADLTYQLRSSLAVEPGNRHSYACRVEHSSLGGQSLLIPWEQSMCWGPGLAVGITLGVLVVAAVAVVLRWSRRRSVDMSNNVPFRLTLHFPHFPGAFVLKANLFESTKVSP